MSEARHILREARPGVHAARARMRDERGASIVIALVFFLICAIIGSVVLTAASVNAKAVQTNRDLQQTEFTVGSAAQLVGSQFSAVVLNVDYAGSSPSIAVDSNRTDDTTAAFAAAFWKANGGNVWTARNSGNAYSTSISVAPKPSGDASEGGADAPEDNVDVRDAAAGTLTVDADLNVQIDLSPASATDAAYRESVFVQCIPTFDQAGRLISFAYEKPVITKTDRGGAS